MARARTLRTDNTWPGFVDALATLLLVITFLLVVFMLAHSLLREALSGQGVEMQRLNSRIAELAELLSMERQAATDMRLSVAQLSLSLQTANRERDELGLRLRDATARAEEAEAELAAANQTIEADRETVTARLGEIERLNRDIVALREVRDDLEDEVATLALALNVAGNEVDRLNAEISNAEIDAQRRAAALQAALLELTTIRDRSQELVAQLTDQQERTALAQRELEDRDLRLAELQYLYNRTTDQLDAMNAQLGLVQGNLADANADRTRLQTDLDDANARILLALADLDRANVGRAQTQAELGRANADRALTQAELDQANADRALTLADLELARAELERRLADLTEEQRIGLAAQQQVALLNQQLLALRQQLQSIEAALQIAEARDRDQLVTIEALGQRLNAALAQRVEELSRYRSEFFGRLREVLGARSDVTIVGDRFVFQSEVLFSVGEAQLGIEGELQLARLASALIEIAAQIPEEINWVLRVDGHTDVQPIATPLFPSNWELSTARAVSVVKFLVLSGVPENRLAATGFGEFQPLDDRPLEEAYVKNRRIELKLTER